MRAKSSKQRCPALCINTGTESFCINYNHFFILKRARDGQMRVGEVFGNLTKIFEFCGKQMNRWQLDSRPKGFFVIT